jgi:hypothetical protein
LRFPKNGKKNLENGKQKLNHRATWKKTTIMAQLIYIIAEEKLGTKEKQQ